MVDVFVERSFRPALTQAGLRSLLSSVPDSAGPALQWRESFIDRGCSRMVCRFTVGHEDALRNALRQQRFEYESLWTGSVHSAAPHVAAPAGRLTYVIAERQLDSAVTLLDLCGIEQCLVCLVAHRVHLIRIFIADDGKRALFLYRAPDAESVRLAHRSGHLPLERAWPCLRVTPTAARSARSGTVR